MACERVKPTYSVWMTVWYAGWNVEIDKYKHTKKTYIMFILFTRLGMFMLLFSCI